jgi:hypothetical protein
MNGLDWRMDPVDGVVTFTTGFKGVVCRATLVSNAWDLKLEVDDPKNERIAVVAIESPRLDDATMELVLDFLKKRLT